MMSKMKKWIACLVAALLVFQAVPAFMEDGEYVSNVMVGSLAGFRDLMEIISEGGSYMLTGETITLTTNEDYTPDWTVENTEVATVESGASASHSAVIKAVDFGETKVTAVDGNQTAVYTLTVVNPDEYTTEAEGTEDTEGSEDGELPEDGENPEDGELTEIGEKTQMVIVVNGGTIVNSYTGEEQLFNEYTAASSNEAFDAEKVVLNRDITIAATECGYYMMNLTTEDFSYADETVSAIFIIEDGYMKINPAKVLVQVEDKAKEAGQDDPELTAVVTGLIGEDTIEYLLIRDEGEEPGSYEIRAEGEELQGNYRIQFQNGMLTIQKAVNRGVTITSSLVKGEPVYEGTEVTLTAHPVGFEDVEFTVQWQYSTDMENWTDVEEGGNGLTYTYVLDKTTVKYKWRVIVSEVTE